MAWFIGQSAVMIVLAFLLGLLVGWLIWGRRAHALYIEVRELREAAKACEANHGGTVDATAKRPADAAKPELVAASTGLSTAASDVAAAGKGVAGGKDPAGAAGGTDVTAGKATNGSAATGKATNGTAAAAKATKAAGKASNGKATNGKATNGKPASGRAGTSTPAAEGATPSGDAAAAADTVAVGDAEMAAASGGLNGATAEKTETATPVHIPAPRAEMTELAVAAEPIEAEAVADDAPVDDLVRIEGIGPKIAAALVTAGIRTFRQLADAPEPALTGAINAAGITFAPSLTTWSQQARLLADDDEEGFLELTERLIAGRVVTAKAAATAADPETSPDDLTRIEGIGPKIAGALIAAGVRTFHQMAATDEETLTKAINAAGITFAPSLYTWSEQAHLLAEGDEEGFAVLTARLIAGRRPDDDLERIEGVGPKMAAALHAAGIRTYRALADSSDVRLRNAVTESGLSFAPSIVTWSRQARLLADGDEEGFADLTKRLVAGRDEERA